MATNVAISRFAGNGSGYRRATLPHQMQKDLLAYLSSAGYKAGDQLPTEQSLCAQFGASRTAVREAMKCLEILGIVSIEPGRGTFLQSFDVGKLLANLPMQLLLQPQDILEVIRVRQVLEEFCLEQAIIHGDADELSRLGDWVHAMKARVDAGESMGDEDTSFHRQLASMAHSRLLLMILELFWGLRRRWPMKDGYEALELRYQRHLRLYTAIRQRDLQLARCYLIEHFSGALEELLPVIEGDVDSEP